MIPLCVPELTGNEWKYIKECLDTNWVSSAGSFIKRFEDTFKDFIGVKNAVATTNGTSALHLALKCLGVKEGDEVIVPSMTFAAPVNAVKYVGAVPVFVDVCRDTYVMDAQKIETLVTDKTKAMLPVHIYGHPVDMDGIMDVARRYSLFVIEDATESLGAFYKGKHTGSIGHAGCFSFNGNKLITAGAGGMMVTNNDELGAYAAYLSTQAKTITENGAFFHEQVGYNYRMPNMNAAMGLAQLENINSFINNKKNHAKLYRELLKNVQGITLPIQKEWAEHAYWLYSILIEDSYGESRNALIEKLKQNGIEARPFFMPVHLMLPYKECRSGDMCVTEDVSSRGINLPSSVGLTQDEISKVCRVIIR